MRHVDKEKLKNWAYKKYRGRCAYCSKPLKKLDATLDHIVPKFLGGTNHRDNIALACSTCNGRKGHLTPQVWRLELLEKSES